MIIFRPKSRTPDHCTGHLAKLSFTVFLLKTQDVRLVGFLSLTQIGPGLLVAGCDPAGALMAIAGNVLVNIFPTSSCPLPRISDSNEPGSEQSCENGSDQNLKMSCIALSQICKTGDLLFQLEPSS